MIDSDVHEKLIATWERNNATGLASDKHALLLEKAIDAIEKRALVTLSSITLMVILDRVLHQSKEKYPVLSMVTIESRNLDFKEFNRSIKEHGSEELLLALRYLLVEILRILGRITADILTVPLHKELMKVTWIDPEQP